MEHGKPLPKPTKKIEVRTRPKPVSDKRKKQLSAYKVLADKFRTDHPTCICGAPASELHHKEGRENELLLDTTKWIMLCRTCHDKATNDSAGAIESGISLSRHRVNI